MSTDLFSQYYDNPQKSYIYSSVVCNSDSADEVGFEISNSSGVITTNGSTLASLDLSDVNVSLEQYTNDSRILEPYQFMYVKGISKGESYMSKSYGPIKESLLEIEDWEYSLSMRYIIEYISSDGLHSMQLVNVTGDEDTSLIEYAQEVMDDASISVSIEVSDSSYIKFTATEIGYEFWIKMVELSVEPKEDIPDSSIPYDASARLCWDFEALDASIIENDPSWLLNSYIAFPFEQVNPDGRHEAYDIDVSVTSSTSSASYTVITAVNEKFTELGLPVEMYVDDTSILKITSKKELYNFWVQYVTVGIPADSSTESDIVSNVQNSAAYDYTSDSSYYIEKGYVYVSDSSSDIAFEDISRYVPAIKYYNGAMKLCVVKAVYPTFNSDDIPNTQHSLKIVHLRDRIEDYYPAGIWTEEGVPTYMRVIRDVVDSHYSRFERDFFRTWSNDKIAMTANMIRVQDLSNILWINAATPSYQDDTHATALSEDIVGLCGYLNWAAIHGLWGSFSNLYIRTSEDDDESQNTYNLIPSFVIYNPNEFPVTVKYMTGF